MVNRWSSVRMKEEGVCFWLLRFWLHRSITTGDSFMVQTVDSASDQRNLLRGVEWETYLKLCDQTDRTACRMTYDQGALEIMTPSMPHESYGSLIGRLIQRYTEIRDIEIRSVASTTFRRSDLLQGFEADESYYVQNTPRIRGLRQVDLTIHPPPDLVVEIEISRSAINKMKLFATMKIPECWRYNERSLSVYKLQQGKYRKAKESCIFPGFPIALAEELLAEQLGGNETRLVQRFAKYVESE